MYLIRLKKIVTQQVKIHFIQFMKRFRIFGNNLKIRFRYLQGERQQACNEFLPRQYALWC